MRLEAAKRYQDFLEKHKNARTLFLELGVGENTPGIIKYPFWNLTYKNKNAFYASLNMEKEEIPIEIKARTVLIKGDIFYTIKKLNMCELRVFALQKLVREQNLQSR